MRKNSFILGILAPALILVLVLTGCNLNGDDDPIVEKYTSEKDGKTYVLEITDGSTYVLTITDDADDTTVTNSGAIESSTGGEIVLKPATGADIIVVATDGQMTGITVTGGGSISVIDETGNTTTETPPGTVVSKDTPKPGPSDGSPIPESNAQVYGMDGKTYTGNDGTVNLVYWAEGSDFPEVIGTAGTVTNGKLTLSLPSSVPDRYLGPGSYLTEQMPGVAITPANVQISFDVDFIFDDSSIGLEKGSENTRYRILYWYFSKGAEITGTFSNTNRGYTQTYDVSAKAGWNRLYRSITESGNTETSTITTDLSKIPSDLRWVIAWDSPGDDNNGDAFAGTWLGTVPGETVDLRVKVVAANGLWTQYLVSGFKDIGLSRGTYTVSGATITCIFTQLNTGVLLHNSDDNWVAYSNLTSEEKTALNIPSDTVIRTISGNEMTVEGVEGVTFTKR
jgi:hypothetical protein